MMVNTVDDVEIPEFATTYCAMTKETRFLSGCNGCDYDVGLAKLETTSEKFGEQYIHLCNIPMPRSIAVIEG